MKKEEKLNYLEMETRSYYSGYGGIEIKEINYGIEDYVVFVAGAWCSHKSVHRVKIYYQDRPYFMYRGNRIYFDECMVNR